MLSAKEAHKLTFQCAEQYAKQRQDENTEFEQCRTAWLNEAVPALVQDELQQVDTAIRLATKQRETRQRIWHLVPDSRFGDTLAQRVAAELRRANYRVTAKRYRLRFTGPRGKLIYGPWATRLAIQW